MLLFNGGGGRSSQFEGGRTVKLLKVVSLIEGEMVMLQRLLSAGRMVMLQKWSL